LVIKQISLEFMANTKRNIKRTKFHPFFFPTVTVLTISIAIVSIYILLFKPQAFTMNPDVLTFQNRLFDWFETQKYKLNNSEQFSIGQMIDTDDMGITIKSAFRGKEIYRYPGFFTDYCKAKTGEIIVVEITIMNTSKKPLVIDHFYLEDTDKRIFKSSNKFSYCIDSRYMLWFPRDINPGMTTSFVSVYEIPTGYETEYSVKISDDKFVKLSYE